MTLKRILMASVSLAALGGGYYGWQIWQASRQAATDTVPETVEVRRGTIQQTVNTDGFVEALLVVEVKSKASGTVASVLVSESDTVTGPDFYERPLSDVFEWPLYALQTGDLLVQLDPIDEQRNLDRQQALLNAELARLARAEAELARVSETVEADMSTALAQREAAAAEVAAAEAESRAAVSIRDSSLQDIQTSEIAVSDGRDKFARQEQLLASKLTSREEYETARNNLRRLEAQLSQTRTDALVAEARIATGTARVAQARARLVQADAQIAVVRASRRSVQVVDQDVALARANVAVARVALADARRRLEETDIVAPIDGVVVKKSVDRGQVISSGTQNVGGGTSLLTLADVSRLFVLASVPEADIELVRRIGNGPPQSVRITADALGGLVLNGEVVYRVPQATTENNVTTVKVRIEVTDQRKGRLMPGETCNVEILSERREGVLVVPAAAVLRADKPNMRMVYVLDAANQPKRVAIKVGIATATEVEVVEGLSEGDRVVASAAAIDPSRAGGRGSGSGKSGGGASGSAKSFRPPRL